MQLYDALAMHVASPGYHLLKISVDSNNEIIETNENNNSWEGSFYWNPIPEPTPTSPIVATLVSPNSSILINKPTYTWNTVSNATWYYLWVSKVNGDGSLTTIHTKWYTSAQACTAGTCSITPDVALSAGNCRWWIQTWNESGYGPWSSGMDFAPTVPVAATLVSPNGSIVDTTPDYTWNKVNASTWYYLWISKVNDDGSLTTIHTKWYTSAQACGAATCTMTPVGVTLTSGNYRWWIQTWNDGGYGPWSSRMDFSLP